MLQIVANGFCSGAVFAIMAVGFALIYSTTRVFHLAHGASYVVGAYIAYVTLVVLGLPMFVALAASFVASSVLGLGFEYVLFSPLRTRGGSPEVAMIASLGAYVAVANTIALLAGNESRLLRSERESTVTFWGASLTSIQLLQVLVAAAVIGILVAVLRFTSAGKWWRAIADNPELAALMGTNVRRLRAAAVAVGSALAGLAGCLEALNSGTDPNVGFRAVLIASIAAVVGSVSSYLGPAAGGFLIGLLQATGVWFTAARWESVFTFSLLLVILIARPTGLFSRRKRLEET